MGLGQGADYSILCRMIHPRSVVIIVCLVTLAVVAAAFESFSNGLTDSTGLFRCRELLSSGSDDDALPFTLLLLLISASCACGSLENKHQPVRDRCFLCVKYTVLLAGFHFQRLRRHLCQHLSRQRPCNAFSFAVVDDNRHRFSLARIQTIDSFRYTIAYRTSLLSPFPLNKRQPNPRNP